MTGFWKKWLAVWCAAVVMFGVVLASGAHPATDAPVDLLYELLNPAQPAAFTPALRFATGLMGALTIGWGLTMAATIGAALRAGPDGAGTWRRLTGAILIWFVVDSGLSILTGFGLNAVSNAVLTAGYLLPVWRSGVLAGR